jgi:hypothetical protein
MAFQIFFVAGAAYFEVGTGLLPLSIIPGDATSTVARAMLEADRGRANAFDLGRDTENGDIAPGDVRSLRNLSGYLPQTWMEARTQVWSYCGLCAALIGNLHPTVAAYHRLFMLMTKSLLVWKGSLILPMDGIWYHAL